MRKVWIGILGAAIVAGLLTVLPSAQGVREARFVAAGDFGARSDTRAVLNGMAAAGPTAALALGDLSYRDAVPESAWCSYVKQSTGEGFPFQLIAGNHDSLDVADGLINNFSACLPNQIAGITGTYGREYFMDFPRTDPLVRVIQVSPTLTFEDGKWNYNAGDPHYQWLSNAIDSGRAAGVKWTVVTAHVPCWSVGAYTCPTTDFFKLMLAKRVDLVLHGHEHGYMRTHQLATGTGTCTTIPTGTVNTACIRDTDSSFTAGVGTVFATVGTGGTPLRNISGADSEAGYFAAFSGLNLNPAYGFLDFVVGEEALTAKFVRTSSGTFSDSFTITRGTAPGNTPPTASFTSTTNGLTASFNGTGSSDAEGPISSYSWSFGDGSPAASGATATRTYASAGTYPVTLTVTDSGGLTGTTTRNVTVTGPVTPPGGTFLAQDTFSRTATSGWGTANIGGAYATSGTASFFAVDGSTGNLTLAAGRGLRAALPTASGSSTDLVTTIGYTGTVTGGGLFVSTFPRMLPDASSYRAKVWIASTGVARVSLVRATAAGAETTLATASSTLTGATSDKRILLRTQATGTSPTTVRARIWFEGDPEPTTWHVQATDATAGWQSAGGVAVFGYMSSSATAPITVRIDDLAARPL